MRCLTLSLLLAAAAPLPVLAQAMVQPLPGSSDADLLGQTMRRVAANPLDVEALVTAGEQSLKVDDLSGAASLFARADKIDPRNGRVKAGMASILVRSERPGEALRYFQQAEAAGLDARRYAADRGLAYDLIGQQDRAQRDYRLALTTGADDETLRRYALSLGISGRRQEALDQLAPLVARSDRAAWRARAFVLAMTGDQREAERIATTMMPGGMAQALMPFFQRLPALAASDRAFAVHFGEVRPTPERIADARLAPALPALVAERPPVQVASATTGTPARTDERRDRRGRRTPPGRVSLAANTATVPPAAAVIASAVQQVAATTPPAPAPLQQVQSLPAVPAPQQVAAAPVQQVQTLPARPAAVTLAAANTTPPPGATTALAPLIQPVPTPAPRPAATTRVPLPAVATAGTTRPVAPVTTRRSNTDAVLARIVASLSIPAEELGVTGPAPRPTPALADAGARTEEAARVKTARDAQADAVAERLVEAKPAAGRRRAKAATVVAEAEAPAPVDRKAAAKQAAAEKKALAEKKAAAAKKLAADKAAAEEKRLARANPSRIWVQVAGGANEGDLPKAWAAAREKGGKSLSGRSGWKTKLRATNRVLTGPFKTDAEARAFVNELNKQGIGAFSFTSEAGQPVTRLPAK